MTATIAASGWTGNNDGGGNGLSFTSPAITAGQRILVGLGGSANGDTFGVPGTGTWTEVPLPDVAVTSSGGLFRLYELSNPVSATVYTFTMTATRRTLVWKVIDGADTSGASIVDVASSLESIAAGTHAPPSVVPVAAGELCIDYLWFRQFNPDASSCTPPASGLAWTELLDVRGLDVAGAGQNVQCAVNYATAGAAGVAVSVAPLNTVDTFEPALVMRVLIKSAAGGGAPVAIADGSGGAGSSGAADGLVLGGGSSSGGSGGAGDGLALGSGADGAASGGVADGLALGSGAAGAGTAGVADGLLFGDGAAGVGSGGSPDGVTAGVQLGDLSGAGGSAGSPDGLALGGDSAASGTGGTVDLPPVGPVTIMDASGSGGSGGTPDSVTTPSQVVHDTMVMPILLKARACLVTEVGKLAFPPARVQLRPGAAFEFQADQYVNECCDGIAWVRPGTMIPTAGDWPNQLSVARKDPPGFYAVTLELGAERCVPIAANAEGGVVTAEQWEQATINAMDDAAALRRVVCCLRTIYGNDSIIENATIPLENAGMCGGQVLTVTVRAPACDCVG